MTELASLFILNNFPQSTKEAIIYEIQIAISKIENNPFMFLLMPLPQPPTSYTGTLVVYCVAVLIWVVIYAPLLCYMSVKPLRTGSSSSLGWSKPSTSFAWSLVHSNIQNVFRYQWSPFALASPKPGTAGPPSVQPWHMPEVTNTEIICSFSKYILGPFVCQRLFTAVNKTIKIPSSWNLHSSRERQTVNWINRWSTKWSVYMVRVYQRTIKQAGGWVPTAWGEEQWCGLVVF